jgi:hypothetical protein
MSRQSTARDTSVMRTEMNPYIVDVPTDAWFSKSKDKTVDPNIPKTETQKERALRLAATAALTENGGKLTKSEELLKKQSQAAADTKSIRDDLKRKNDQLQAVLDHTQGKTQSSSQNAPKKNSKTSSQDDSDEDD